MINTWGELFTSMREWWHKPLKLEFKKKEPVVPPTKLSPEQLLKPQIYKTAFDPNYVYRDDPRYAQPGLVTPNYEAEVEEDPYIGGDHQGDFF